MLPQGPANPRHQSWWAQANIFSRADPVNESIWIDSPPIHARQGFTPAGLTHPGAVGAQQAMLDPTVTIGLANPAPILPWVPDLLGNEWTHECGIVIIGQNYGQFIAGYTTRPKCMSAHVYAMATDWQGFQKTFVKEVVIDDKLYYERLAPLLGTTESFARFVVCDLVRTSLAMRATVVRRKGMLQRIDAKIDLNDASHCKVYGDYANLAESVRWMWDRLTSSRARVIIALGRTPLCGLLRLCASKGCTIYDYQSRTPWAYTGSRWMYNCGITSIEDRLQSGEWHVIQDSNLARTWHVVLVSHPARENSDYTTALPVVKAARRAAGC
jgi:hypothetical protein